MEEWHVSKAWVWRCKLNKWGRGRGGGCVRAEHSEAHAEKV